MSKSLLRIGAHMVRKAIQAVGPLSLSQFHDRCLRMVKVTAGGIRRGIEQGNVQIDSKVSYAGVQGADVVTSIDLTAQQKLAELARRYMPPQVGYIGEEQGLRRPSTFIERPVVLTFDPADGTRRLIAAIRAKRPLAPGEVSVMLGVQVDGRAVAGYICDVATLVTYARQMYSSHVVRIAPNDSLVDMALMPRATRLGTGVLLRHGAREVSNPLTSRLLEEAFPRVQRGSDSIGLSVARVFTGDFVGMLRVAGMHVTPWDDTPIQALCQQGDVIMLKVATGGLEELSFDHLDRVTRQDYDVLYIHRRYLEELRRHVTVTTRV